MRLIFILLLTNSLFGQETLNITNELKKISLTENCSYFLPAGRFIIDDQISFRNENFSLIGKSSAETEIIWNGSSKGNALIVNAKKIMIKNLTFNGNYNEVASGLIEIANDSITQLLIAEHVVVKYVKGKKNGSKNNYGMIIHTNHTKKVKIKNCSFENISSYSTDNKEGQGDGFCGGIFFYSKTPLTNIHEYNYKIKNSNFKNIFTENCSTNGWDSDGIRFYSGANFSELTNKCKLKIKKSNFERVQKSAIKISGANGVRIIKNTIVSDSIMLCPVRIQWGKNVIVKKNEYSGKFIFGINLIGENIKIKQNYIDDNFLVLKKIISIQNIDKIKNNKIKTYKKCFKLKKRL